MRDPATPAASDDARTIGTHPPPPPHARPLSTTLSQVTALSVSCGSAWCPRRAVPSARVIRSAREPGEGMGLSRDQGSTLHQPHPCTSSCSAERSSETATANNRQSLDQDTRQRQETKGMNETGTHQERPRGGAGRSRAGRLDPHTKHRGLNSSASLLPLNSFQKDLPAARGSREHSVW